MKGDGEAGGERRGKAVPQERPEASEPGSTAAGPPDLLYGETETELRAAVRALLEDRCGWREVLARTESPQAYDPGLWQVLAAELGCAGLLIPEGSGGAGASYREAAVVAEETGRAVAPVPFLGSAVVATAALLATSDDELLTAVADGATTAALAVPFAAAPGPRPEPTVRLGVPAPGDGDPGYRLTGTVAGVADALPADVLLVPADGVPYGLYAVRAADVAITPVVSLDMTRQLADLTLDNVPGRRVATAGAAQQAVAAALTAGAAMLAAEQLGTAERCLEITVAYLKERRQFARTIGSFQALKHRLADLWTAITLARAASRYAAACLADGDPDTKVAVALAKSACCEAAVTAAEECVQLHGGIGFTWEHPVHLFLKRAKAASVAFGTPGAHHEALSTLANIPAPEA